MACKISEKIDRKRWRKNCRKWDEKIEVKKREFTVGLRTKTKSSDVNCFFYQIKIKRKENRICWYKKQFLEKNLSKVKNVCGICENINMD